MITTVTTNTALDVAAILDSLDVGAVNRSAEAAVHPGGKGVNVAKAARALGADVTATGFLGTGPIGASLKAALGDTGVAHDFVELPGDTRVTFVLYDLARGSETIVNNPAGYRAAAEDVAGLSDRVAHHAARSSFVVFSGSLPDDCPPDTYRTLIQRARDAGARTVLDSSGAALSEGLHGAPFMVKPTRVELETILERPLPTHEAIFDACGCLREMGVEAVVVSMGPEGALAVFGDERYVARPVSAEVVSAIGAGDAMVAGIVVALEQGAAAAAALAMGCAAATSSLGRYGAGLCLAEETAEIQSRVKVERV
jgi:1-phosphofructokinase family hexose kinase